MLVSKEILASDLYLSSFKVRPGYHVTIPQEELATYPHQIQVAVPMTEAALSQDNLFLLATEVLRNCRTGIFYGVAKLPRGIAENGIAIPIEYGNFVPMSYQPFATFVVKDHGVIGFIFVVCHRVLQASLIESLNDLCCLRSCPS
jgi:hypothetical protein